MSRLAGIFSGRQPPAQERPQPRGRRSSWLRRAGLVLLLLLMLVGSFPWLWRAAVETVYRGRTYTVASAPAAPVAVVFGARVYRNGGLSAMLRDRVDTAVDLYLAGKVDLLLLSGGQTGAEYDEPAAMFAHALARGVPRAAMRTDHGGYRTYDTCYRAVHIFQAREVLLVTQEFHLPRALLLCQGLGLDVAGVIADRRVYSPGALAWSESRELPALLAALVDLVRREPPPVLGDPRPLF